MNEWTTEIPQEDGFYWTWNEQLLLVWERDGGYWWKGDICVCDELEMKSKAHITHFMRIEYPLSPTKAANA